MNEIIRYSPSDGLRQVPNKLYARKKMDVRPTNPSNLRVQTKISTKKANVQKRHSNQFDEQFQRKKNKFDGLLYEKRLNYSGISRTNSRADHNISYNADGGQHGHVGGDDFLKEELKDAKMSVRCGLCIDNPDHPHNCTRDRVLYDTGSDYTFIDLTTPMTSFERCERGSKCDRQNCGHPHSLIESMFKNCLQSDPSRRQIIERQLGPLPVTPNIVISPEGEVPGTSLRPPPASRIGQSPNLFGDTSIAPSTSPSPLVVPRMDVGDTTPGSTTTTRATIHVPPRSTRGVTPTGTRQQAATRSDVRERMDSSWAAHRDSIRSTSSSPRSSPTARTGPGTPGSTQASRGSPRSTRATAGSSATPTTASPGRDSIGSARSLQQYGTPTSRSSQQSRSSGRQSATSSRRDSAGRQSVASSRRDSAGRQSVTSSRRDSAERQSVISSRRGSSGRSTNSQLTATTSHPLQSPRRGSPGRTSTRQARSPGASPIGESQIGDAPEIQPAPAAAMADPQGLGEGDASREDGWQCELCGMFHKYTESCKIGFIWKCPHCKQIVQERKKCDKECGPWQCHKIVGNDVNNRCYKVILTGDKCTCGETSDHTPVAAFGAEFHYGYTEGHIIIGQEQLPKNTSMYDTIRQMCEAYNSLIRAIPGKGACLFESLAEQFRFIGVGKMTAHQIRINMVKYIKENKDTVIPGSTQTVGEFVKHASYLNNESVEQYIARMRSPGEWGDMASISIVALVYDHPFILYTIDATKRIQRFERHGGATGDIVKIIGTGTHFFTLRPNLGNDKNMWQCFCHKNNNMYDWEKCHKCGEWCCPDCKRIMGPEFTRCERCKIQCRTECGHVVRPTPFCKDIGSKLMCWWGCPTCIRMKKEQKKKQKMLAKNRGNNANQGWDFQCWTSDEDYHSSSDSLMDIPSCHSASENESPRDFGRERQPVLNMLRQFHQVAERRMGLTRHRSAEFQTGGYHSDVGARHRTSDTVIADMYHHSKRNLGSQMGGATKMGGATSRDQYVTLSDVEPERRQYVPLGATTFNRDVGDASGDYSQRLHYYHSKRNYGAQNGMMMETASREQGTSTRDGRERRLALVPAREDNFIVGDADRSSSHGMHPYHSNETIVQPSRHGQNKKTKSCLSVSKFPKKVKSKSVRYREPLTTRHEYVQLSPYEEEPDYQPPSPHITCVPRRQMVPMTCERHPHLYAQNNQSVRSTSELQYGCLQKGPCTHQPQRITYPTSIFPRHTTSCNYGGNMKVTPYYEVRGVSDHARPVYEYKEIKHGNVQGENAVRWHM